MANCGNVLRQSELWVHTHKLEYAVAATDTHCTMKWNKSRRQAVLLLFLWVTAREKFDSWGSGILKELSSVAFDE